MLRMARTIRRRIGAKATAACPRRNTHHLSGQRRRSTSPLRSSPGATQGIDQAATPLFPAASPPPDCPVAKLEPLGVALYKDFRRRYGLTCTTEERIAGLLGALLEHRKSSAILRLFARIVGAPADGGRPGGALHPQDSQREADYLMVWRLETGSVHLSSTTFDVRSDSMTYRSLLHAKLDFFLV